MERPATRTLSTQSTTTTSSASALDKLSSSLERITPHPPELRLRRRRRRHVHALRRLRVPREPAAPDPPDALRFVLVFRVGRRRMDVVVGVVVGEGLTLGVRGVRGVFRAVPDALARPRDGEVREVRRLERHLRRARRRRHQLSVLCVLCAGMRGKSKADACARGRRDAERGERLGARDRVLVERRGRARGVEDREGRGWREGAGEGDV